jgi:hypothetical protein
MLNSIKIGSHCPCTLDAYIAQGRNNTLDRSHMYNLEDSSLALCTCACVSLYFLTGYNSIPSSLQFPAFFEINKKTIKMETHR